jgi:hypothetical protein
VDRQWHIRVTLSNGETRHLAGTAGTAEEVGRTLEAFERDQTPLRGAWLETTESTAIARAHIVEASIVPV